MPLPMALRQQLPAILKDVEHTWAQYILNNRDNLNAQNLCGQLEQLSVTSFMCDLSRIGLAAKEMESLVAEISQCSPSSSERMDILVRIMQERLDTLRLAMRVVKPGSENDDVYYLRDGIPSLQDHRASRLIYLLESDPVQAREMATQIGYFGYTVQVFNQLENAREAIRKAVPAAILIDLAFPSGDEEQSAGERFSHPSALPVGIVALAELRQFLPLEQGVLRTPVIFIAASDNFSARLQATRAGGQAYFVKPVDVSDLVDTLDRLCDPETPPPYRVLIVDDDRIQANYYAMHLKKAAMTVEILTDPSLILQLLTDFNPDLILMDMYMPGCSGMDLAQVIRQIESYLSVPIVYLSSETDQAKQIEALGMGGDDFLAKPIQPAYLISAVASRVDRYRKLRSLMLCDSLTGLLNHTTIKERLAQEVARAGRQQGVMTFAMLDIDLFKAVNDTYGHAVGDRVLKSLAQLLSKRLRSMDTIGRYGGEEFAIILPNVSYLDAAMILDDIRERFANLHHRAERGSAGAAADKNHPSEAEFRVTFSCGLACYPGYPTASALIAAADQALYSAKSRGRDQVVRAEG